MHRGTMRNQQTGQRPRGSLMSTATVSTVKVTLSAAVAASSKPAVVYTADSARAKPAAFFRDLERTLLDRKASRLLPDQTIFDLRKCMARAMRGAVNRAELTRAEANNLAAVEWLQTAASIVVDLGPKVLATPLRDDENGGQWTAGDIVNYWFSGESKPDAAKRAGY